MRTLARAMACAVAGLAIAGLAPAALGAQQAAQQAAPATAATAGPTRSLIVRVVTAPEGAPLGYSVVQVPGSGLERFTNASGVVAVPVPASGPVRLVVKRLGFTPKDTTVAPGAGASASVTVALARVSFRLQAVTVVAWPPCRRPGLGRRSGASDEVRAVVEQLRQNAERYRLLTTDYPFIYLSRRDFGVKQQDGRETYDRTDTIRVSGRPDWSYRPGTLVARETNADGSREWVMRIPSIADLASDLFIDNHCFHVAGLEEKGGRRLLRIDIVAADRLKGTDVTVVAWLDPDGFALRHATFTLSKVPPQFPDLLTMSSRVEYAELIPFVPVMEVMVAESLLRGRPRGAPAQVALERQRIERVLFVGATPEGLALDSVPSTPRP